MVGIVGGVSSHQAMRHLAGLGGASRRRSARQASAASGRAVPGLWVIPLPRAELTVDQRLVIPDGRAAGHMSGGLSEQGGEQFVGTSDAGSIARGQEIEEQAASYRYAKSGEIPCLTRLDS